MRCQSQSKGSNRYYRCRAGELGYTCDQGGVQVEKIDQYPDAVEATRQLAKANHPRYG